MRTRVIEKVDPTSPIATHAQWFYRSLKASKRSAATIEVYVGAIAHMDRFLATNAMPRDLSKIKRQHVEAFILDQLERLAPASAAARYSGARSFFKWAVEEGEIASSPMAAMRPPQVPDVPVKSLDQEECKALVKACEGTSLRQRRDMAIIRFMLDTGCRRSEVAGMRVTDIDQDDMIATVTGKGSRTRTVAYTATTAQAIDRYLRKRDEHKQKASPFLWLGRVGPMSGDAIAGVVSRRSERARVFNVDPAGGQRPLHAHQLRHTFADRFLSNGGSEGDLMQLGGWRSAEIMRKYGRSRATVRAIDAARRIALGDAF